MPMITDQVFLLKDSLRREPRLMLFFIGTLGLTGTFNMKLAKDEKLLKDMTMAVKAVNGKLLYDYYTSTTRQLKTRHIIIFRDGVMHFVARSLSSAPSTVLKRCSDSRDTRNEEAELKPKVWITIVIKSVESIPKYLESVEKKSGEFSQIWAVVTTCVVIVAHSFGMKSGRKLIPEVWIVMLIDLGIWGCSIYDEHPHM
nr:hypothetical protein [Tanacetum cinerariifolium]